MEMGGESEGGLFARLTHDAIGAAIQVQRVLGPWLLESAYQQCLAYELTNRGHRVEQQVPVGIRYGDLLVPNAYRIDLVVDEVLVIELKVVEALIKEHESQLLSYLRFSNKPIGLLINFGVQPLVPKGIRRLLMTQPGLSASPSSSSVSSV